MNVFSSNWKIQGLYSVQSVCFFFVISFVFSWTVTVSESELVHLSLSLSLFLFLSLWTLNSFSSSTGKSRMKRAPISRVSPCTLMKGFIVFRLQFSCENGGHGGPKRNKVGIYSLGSSCKGFSRKDRSRSDWHNLVTWCKGVLYCLLFFSGHLFSEFHQIWWALSQEKHELSSGPPQYLNVHSWWRLWQYPRSARAELKSLYKCST